MSNRFKDSGKTFRETGNFEFSIEEKQFFKDIIKKANSVSIKLIFNYYKVPLSEFNSKTTCPFLSHKGGQERTPSFEYYSKTNTYHCHGCKVGNRPCDFVAEMEGISKVKAAYKILKLYGSKENIEEYIENNIINYSEHLELMMDFSENIREFIQFNINNNAAINYIEQITSSFDEINTKYILNIEALKRLISFFKDKILNKDIWQI